MEVMIIKYFIVNIHKKEKKEQERNIMNMIMDIQNLQVNIIMEKEMAKEQNFTITEKQNLKVNIKMEKEMVMVQNIMILMAN